MTVAAHQHDGSRDRATEATHDRVAEPTRVREPERAPAPVSGARGTHDLATLPVAAGRGTSLWRGPIVQTKLSVSVPRDPLEREADAVAARVVRGADARPPRAPDLAVRGRLMRAAAPARGPPAVTGPSERGPPSVGSIVAQGGGRPLDAAVRARIEPHVGMDLGSVRVRDGPDAAAAAHALHARAFTSGTTIFLAASSSPTDVGLMAHEATHVVQQTSRPATRTTLMRAFGDLLPDISLPDISVADVIPASVLDGVRSLVQSIPGYTLLTQIAGVDPLTGQPVAVSREELIDRLLSYGPFSAAVSGALQAFDVVDDVFDELSAGLVAHNLTLARIEGDIDSAWSQLSIGGGIQGNVAIVERFVERALADVLAFVTAIADRVIALVRSAAAAVAGTLLDTPVWALAKKVMHYDPLLGVPVEAPTVEILGDFLRLAGQEERLAQMEERNTLQKTADWLDTQFAIWIGLIGELMALFSDAWAAIQPANLPDLPANVAALAVRVVALVQGVALFEATVIAKVLELVRYALLGWLSEYAHVIPGFHLLTVIIGRNPFTGEVVELTAENLIRGFITLIPGGEAIYDQFAEAGVIAAAAGRIEAAISDLGLSVELVTATFLGIWNSLTLDDLLDPIGAFVRVLEAFGEPLLRLARFVPVVIGVVVELVLQLMNFPTELLGSIVANVRSAIGDIARDPIGFLMNMVAALKAGFTSFFANIVGHLTQGLVDWLFRGLRHLGITAPPDFSLGSILDLIFQVLGLTAEALWAKLAEHVPAETVALIRESIDRLTGAWAFLSDVEHRGLAAIWEFVGDQLGSLWETVLGAAMEWVMTQIITSGTIKLLSFLDPTFIMSVINGCIAFFNAVQAAIEYLRDMLEILNLYVGTLAQVAAGNIAPGAEMIEKGFASAVPVAIGFLAYLLGIDDIPYRIAGIIERVRGVIEKALDWLITQALRLGSAALSALGGGGAAGAGAPTAAAPAEASGDPLLIPLGLTPDQVKIAAFDLIAPAAQAAQGDDALQMHALVERIAALNQPRGLKSLTAHVDDEGSMDVSFDATASARQQRTIAWSDLFGVARTKDEKALQAEIDQQGMGTTAVLSVNGQQHGSPSRSAGPEPPKHAEHRLVNSATWASAVALARSHDFTRESLTIAIAINRAPCQGCAQELTDKLDDVPDLVGKVDFILAPTGIYEPTREASAAEVAADRALYAARAAELGVPFEKLWDKVQLALYLDVEKATRAFDLQMLAGAGWDVRALRAGSKVKPFSKILGEYAHTLALQLGRP